MTPETLIERAREMTPKLAERARACQENRSIPTETIADIQEAGLLRVMQPSRWGGYEMDPQVFFQIQAALAEGCMSTAWVYGVVAVHNWQIALFDLKAQEDVWKDDTSALIASSYMPVGKVEQVEGGFKFSGRWAFSSGCGHCDWAFLGGLVPPDEHNPAPDYRTFLVPKEDYQIIDTWHVFGLQGTGSNDILIEDTFVPTYRTHRSIDGFTGTNPGPDSRSIPLYRIPFGQLFPRAVSSGAIGALQGAVNAYQEVAAKRVSSLDGSNTNADHSAQMVLAEAQSTVDQLYAKLMANFDVLMADARADQSTDIDTRIQYRYESAAVPDTCLEQALAMHKIVGGRGIFLSAPLQRFMLDILASRAHVANDPKPFGRNMGGTRLGLENTDFFL